MLPVSLKLGYNFLGCLAVLTVVDGDSDSLARKCESYASPHAIPGCAGDVLISLVKLWSRRQGKAVQPAQVLDRFY